jgi:hypothetical protein
MTPEEIAKDLVSVQPMTNLNGMSYALNQLGEKQKKTLKDKLLDELMPENERYDGKYFEFGDTPTHPIEGDVWSKNGQLFGFINGKPQKL